VSASIFGDDDALVGSKSAVDFDIQAREALGLQTKWEATGIADFAHEGELTGNCDQLGLFTERLIDLSNLSEVTSVKPAGVVRLYQAYHPSQLFLSTKAYLADLEPLRRQIGYSMPEWADIVSRDAERNIVMLHARRETAPRRILSNLLRKDIGPKERVARGNDVARLFDLLEMVLLQSYPSTKGAPSRLEDPAESILGHPVVSYNRAVTLGNWLHGGDCYFKLQGPPLFFNKGDFASVIAAAQLVKRGNQYFASPEEAMRLVGWGDHLNQSTDLLPSQSQPLNLEPLSYDDLTE
jgi:hypothetical protein